MPGIHHDCPMTGGFGDGTKAALGHYVYALAAPGDGPLAARVFYVGKGQGDRAHAHLAEELAADDTAASAKLDRIRALREAGTPAEIRVVAHDLTKTQAFALEAHLIGVLHGLTNAVGGHRGVDYWLTERQMEERYDTPIEAASLNRNMLFVGLGGGDGLPPYPEIADDETLKSRCLDRWPVSEERMRRVDTVIGCYKGLARCAFKVASADLREGEKTSPTGKRRWLWTDGVRDSALEQDINERRIVDGETVLTKNTLNPATYFVDA